MNENINNFRIGDIVRLIDKSNCFEFKNIAIGSIATIKDIRQDCVEVQWLKLNIQSTAGYYYWRFEHVQITDLKCILNSEQLINHLMRRIGYYK